MSSLNKQRQKYLFNWLKQQAKQQKRLLFASVLTGFCSAICVVIQAGLLAITLNNLIIEQQHFVEILPYLIGILAIFILRAAIVFVREQINFVMGLQIRKSIRAQLLDNIKKSGPTSLQQQTTGSWTTLLIEQVEDLQDFYAHYLPQIRLASIVPILIVITIFPFNWAAAIILLCTAPLIPIFMILVGLGAAESNRKNFQALSRLSGHFLDRLKGLKTIQLFHQGQYQTNQIEQAAEDFRQKTMKVLSLAFLSSGVLEFFASISIAIVAVYFGFAYLGEFNFGAYGQSITLFAGFFALILAPEFFQPLRDLGTFYHAKAQAIAAADNIEKFLFKNQRLIKINIEEKHLFNQPINTIIARDLIALSHDGKPLIEPISFELHAPFKLALLGISGEGKSSLMNVLLGFLTYQGSLTINHVELKHIELTSWQKQISWVGQNPYLLNDSIKNNITLSKPNATLDEINQVIEQAQLKSFIEQLPLGIETQVGEDAVKLSLGQAQRIAIARALLKPCQLLLLDEPTASLDKQTALAIDAMLANNYRDRNVITITHLANDLSPYNIVWRLANKQLTQITGADHD